ncbi:hypothetical protein BHE74_00047418 [Ensete ventricosum]|nr:hypothetical protein BHE74_00047418 [Ensete ventricosum]
MMVDFPRWEEGDPTGWILRGERYFRYHKTPDASMVDIVAIRLEGDVIQWYDWFEHTHRVPTWRQFKSELLIRFRSIECENIDDQLVKIRQTSTTMKIGGCLKQQPVTVLVNTGSTNNFMNNKVVAWMLLQTEECSRFDVKVADGRIVKCDQKCPG